MKGFKTIEKNLHLDKFIRRIDWYIIKKFLGTYFFAIALIISIAVVFDVNEWIDNFINNKAPVKAIIFDQSSVITKPLGPTVSQSGATSWRL